MGQDLSVCIGYVCKIPAVCLCVCCETSSVRYVVEMNMLKALIIFFFYRTAVHYIDLYKTKE